MIAQNIRAYIKERGFNQAEIARKAGMTTQALSDSLRGVRRLTADEYVNLCRALDRTPNDFTPENFTL